MHCGTLLSYNTDAVSIVIDRDPTDNSQCSSAYNDIENYL